ncbi:amidase signature domain-containing protein [Penicillium angulare]|uniref:amidase signature domain-containing protein n=1 Tax=Penicillium angulare TaxID=116970 RepID=UPI00253FD98D|nr:amidase signature domain-containing protein [Penicillium angulare]KAJ5289132.1 amidase signature domain-containing protein [Penicillium angulare]
MNDINILTASAADLQKLLVAGEYSSTDLVKLYLEQIEAHNTNGLKLNAVITTAPRAELLHLAEQLDVERAEKGLRGPLHGIPVLVKDVFWTPSLNMDTTCGSFALRGAKAPRNAEVIDILLAAGAVIIGKGNMSEWGGNKGSLITAGWSALGGQTQSPYVRGGVLPNATFLGHSTPCGSTSGPAVGVAAGFAPLMVGTETDGSLVQPSTRAALYGLKLTVGTISTYGVQPLSKPFDSIGGAAKTTEDLANLLDTLVPGRDFKSSLTKSWKNIKVGLVDPMLWQPADFVVEPNDGFLQQTLKEINQAVEMVEEQGAQVVKNAHLISLAEILEQGGTNIDDFIGHDFQSEISEFLSALDNPHRVKSLKDLVDFNAKNPALELPPGSTISNFDKDHSNQDVLIASLDNNMTDEHYEVSLKKTRDLTRAAIKKSINENGINVIMGPADARIATVASIAGYPVATIPLGYADFNGRAFGLNIIGLDQEEDRILEVMSAWEETFPNAHQPPPMLVDWPKEATWSNM